MAKILGYEIVKGNFEGHDYENIYLTLEKNFSKEKKEKGLVSGTCANVVKVKASVVRDFETGLRINGHGGLIGKNIRILYDSFNKPAMLQLID